jgi:predicted NUDIX family NTP pyrophosphohydrolase
MGKKSAGLLMFRFRNSLIQVLLIHPGGPFWINKDCGAWSIPKGLIEQGEDQLVAAQREFEEETGFKASGPFIPLAPIRQASGKLVLVWAFEGDCNVIDLKSNTFSIEWPPRSGLIRDYPEVDRAEWFPIAAAREKILKSQISLLDELEKKME